MLRCRPRVVITNVLLVGHAVQCSAYVGFPAAVIFDTPMFEVAVVIPYHTALYHMPGKLSK